MEPDHWLHAAHHLNTAANAVTRYRALEVLAAASQLRPDAPNTLVSPSETLITWIRDGEHTVIDLDADGAITPAFFGATPDPCDLRRLNLGPTLLEELQERRPDLESFKGLWGLSYRVGMGVVSGLPLKIELVDGVATLSVGDQSPISAPCPSAPTRAEEYKILEELLAGGH